jgi:hypothetical protein
MGVFVCPSKFYYLLYKSMLNSLIVIHMIKITRSLSSLIKQYGRSMTKMKKTILLLVLLNILFQTWGQSDTSYRLEGWKGSSAYAQKRKYDGFLKRVYALDGNNIRVDQIGIVTYDGVEYPVTGLSYTPQTKPKNFVLLVSGAHGNEPAGPEAIIRFFTYLGKHPEKYDDVAIDAIPMVNPWGWTRNIRQNANGYDINRDFINFLTKEARIVRDFGKRHAYNLVIDHHEARADGAFIYAYGDEDSENARNLMRYLKESGYAIVKRRGSSFKPVTDGVVSIPSVHRGFRPVRWRNRSTIVRYFNRNGDVHGFTMETSTLKKINNRIDVHVEVMKFLIDIYT